MWYSILSPLAIRWLNLIILVAMTPSCIVCTCWRFVNLLLILLLNSKWLINWVAITVTLTAKVSLRLMTWKLFLHIGRDISTNYLVFRNRWLSLRRYIHWILFISSCLLPIEITRLIGTYIVSIRVILIPSLYSR